MRFGIVLATCIFFVLTRTVSAALPLGALAGYGQYMSGQQSRELQQQQIQLQQLEIQRQQMEMAKANQVFLTCASMDNRQQIPIEINFSNSTVNMYPASITKTLVSWDVKDANGNIIHANINRISGLLNASNDKSQTVIDNMQCSVGKPKF